MSALDRDRHFNNLLTEMDGLLSQAPEPEAGLQAVCELLHRRVAHYDWVGFYWTHPAQAATLVLGPYSGAATEHTEIPFGRGICGQAAANRATYVVQDVSQEANYLACSLETKAEIVLPIFRAEQLIGELDIDSHTPAPFTNADESFLSAVIERVLPLAPQSASGG